MTGKLCGTLRACGRRLELVGEEIIARFLPGMIAVVFLFLLAGSPTKGLGRVHRDGAAFQNGRLQGLPPRPKLLIVLIIDQFRADYLVRFRPQFVAGGFNLLLSGADFVNCRYEQAVTATGPGHATLLTGAYPDTHGIIGNDWFDRELNRAVNCVEDPSTRIVDDSGRTSESGRSPHYLMGTTVGDELRAATSFESRVVSIALKDRGAILPGGHTANAAYWYDAAKGQFISSTYYMPALPSWVAQFNTGQPAKAYCGKPWQSLTEGPGGASTILKPNPSDPHGPCPSTKFLAWLDQTPFMSEIELGFAKDAIRSEKLGQGQSTDMLTVSLSENDYVGHEFGPYSPQVADMTLRTDRYLADFLKFVDETVGFENVWIALSADHGVAPTPQFIREHHLGPGLANMNGVIAKAKDALSERFGTDSYFDPAPEFELYFNRDVLRKHKISQGEAEDVVAEAVRAIPGVRMVLTRRQVLEGRVPQSRLASSVAKSFYARRSGDVLVVYDPFAVRLPGETAGTSHGTPWNYDAQVPILLWGVPFQPGVYVNACHTADFAATLAVVLGLNQPSGAVGEPLREALK